MVQIVHTRPQYADSSRAMRLKIHLSSKDNATAIGTIDPIFVIHEGQWVTLVSRFGTPATESFEIALKYSEGSNIPTLWIDDPCGLFPLH